MFCHSIGLRHVRDFIRRCLLGMLCPFRWPCRVGAVHGVLGSSDMSDYFYKKESGWTYVYSNVQKIYDGSGNVTSTLTGSNDTIRSLGYSNLAPNGDSLFKIAITYRVLSSYSNGSEMDMYFMKSIGGSGHGALVYDGPIGGDTLSPFGGGKKPRPVSTDTILAGLVGPVRGITNDFTNSGTFTWKTDTIAFTSHLDTVTLWEDVSGTLTESREIFNADFTNNLTWAYDIINLPSNTTLYKAVKPDTSITTSAGTYGHSVDIRVISPGLNLYGLNREDKWYGCGAGIVYEYDWWYVTTDGSSFHKEDFAHELISLHN